MRRNRGMGILFDAFEFLFVETFLLATNMFLMFFFGLLRNLPEILRSARHALREFLILTYRAYKPIVNRLQPIAQRLLHLEIGKTPLRVIATGIISLLLLLVFDLVVGWPISLLLSVLAILHGTTVGLLWDDLDHADGLQTGERL